MQNLNLLSVLRWDCQKHVFLLIFFVKNHENRYFQDLKIGMDSKFYAGFGGGLRFERAWVFPGQF